nr:phosphoribosylanthranilate isomerase [Aureitalea marina]
MRLKICGVKEQAEELAGLGPDYLGFIFYDQSPRYFKSEIPNTTKEVRRVGVFVNETPETVLKIQKKHQLDILQLHGDESPEVCELLGREAEIWKVFGLNQEFDFSQLTPYLPVVDMFLFDTKSKARGGTGKTFDWSVLKGYDHPKPFMLSGGIGPEHVQEINHMESEFPMLYGIDINSRFESEPGLKDIERIKRFKDELSR